jgi:hypothetical protein
VFDLPTPSTPKLPWLSLALLLLADTTFGWLVYDWTRDREIWLSIAFGLTLMGAIVTYPSLSVAMIFGRFLKTDTRALILIIVTSIISVILVAWLHFFINVLVLCSAGLLVSLDLKIRGWRKQISLLLIIGWQLLGLSAGLGFNYLHLHPLTNMPAFFYLNYWLKFFDQLKF